MNKAFEKHRDKRISEIRKRMLNYKLNKKVKMKTSRQRVQKM